MQVYITKTMIPQTQANLAFIGMVLITLLVFLLWWAAGLGASGRVVPLHCADVWLPCAGELLGLKSHMWVVCVCVGGEVVRTRVTDAASV